MVSKLSFLWKLKGGFCGVQRKNLFTKLKKGKVSKQETSGFYKQLAGFSAFETIKRFIGTILLIGI